MRELVRTNDAVLISAIEALLKGANIRHMLVDVNMSGLEGSIGIFPRRILVEEDELEAARVLLENAGFANETRRDGDLSGRRDQRRCRSRRPASLAPAAQGPPLRPRCDFAGGSLL